MKPGDLVHVTADNSYHGVGIIVAFSYDLDRYPARVLLEGKMISLFASELEAVDEDKI